ncbi:uncharacterized protein LOC128255351 [Drosophila gunungcola]|uniref:Uncharacterized protein n=1 Tax=Drosophila gunungcola TaxID=103775 RepID=A0A9P9YIJ0_9MUSC|nr:uncharacterized protein LOC128255351 [Drosophila gunungcola]KAI8037441.1 hypothetical protein M5D96_009578 [Drosophila gunungcola]
MLLKILRKYGTLNHLVGNHHHHPHNNHSRNARCGCGSGCGVLPGNCRELHDWDRQSAAHDQRRKIIPKLVYLHNPWKYLVTKFNLWKLKWLWDRDFSEPDFLEGAKQAAIVMTDIIRQQSADKISEYTTPVGFQQITRDMLLSRNDTRLQLVRFEREHLRRAIPMKVATRQNFGRKYAFIDMLFVGLRNTKDFDTASEVVEVSEIIRRMDNELKTPPEVVAVPHRIVFAEIFIRFRRDYTADARRVVKANGPQAHNFPFNSQFNAPTTPTTMANTKPPQEHFIQSALDPMRSPQNPSMTALPPNTRILPRMDDVGWSVSFYKILTFDVLNYDPQSSRNQQHQTH